ncbi:MAG: CPBP family intramembrane glutamic endopeptidase [Eubacteriales bacterium]|nr:CPBP family intramembrane glutamic endopeptidase [Eubacteriales bacterium]
MKNFFAPCQDYLDEVKSIKKTDAYLVLYIMIWLGYSFWRSGYISAKAGDFLSETQMMMTAGISTALTVFLIFIFCKLRGQKIRSLGLNSKYAKQSLLAGTLLSILYIVIFRMVHKGEIRSDIEMNSIFIFRILYEVFFVALFEEIVIRVYTGMRLRALFKNKTLSVFVTGFLWALLHMPAYAASAQMGVFEYVAKGLWPLSTYIVLHIILNIIYSKYNNVIGGTLLHATINILSWLYPV